jgi:hypothetical protein
MRPTNTTAIVIIIDDRYLSGWSNNRQVITSHWRHGAKLYRCKWSSELTRDCQRLDRLKKSYRLQTIRLYYVI